MSGKPKHGLSRSPEYAIYQMAKDRCTNPKSQRWETHGGRGIQFLFTSFEQFITTVGSRPSGEYSLDRYPDNNGNYEPRNVRWATRSQQQKNKRKYSHLVRHGKGFYFHKASQKWMARIRYQGQMQYLGLFGTQREAKEAYRQALVGVLERINGIPKKERESTRRQSSS